MTSAAALPPTRRTMLTMRTMAVLDLFDDLICVPTLQQQLDWHRRNPTPPEPEPSAPLELTAKELANVEAFDRMYWRLPKDQRDKKAFALLTTKERLGLVKMWEIRRDGLPSQPPRESPKAQVERVTKAYADQPGVKRYTDVADVVFHGTPFQCACGKPMHRAYGSDCSRTAFYYCAKCGSGAHISDIEVAKEPPRRRPAKKA